MALDLRNAQVLDTRFVNINPNDYPKQKGLLTSVAEGLKTYKDLKDYWDVEKKKSERDKLIKSYGSTVDDGSLAELDRQIADIRAELDKLDKEVAVDAGMTGAGGAGGFVAGEVVNDPWYIDPNIYTGRLMDETPTVVQNKYVFNSGEAPNIAGESFTMPETTSDLDTWFTSSQSAGATIPEVGGERGNKDVINYPYTGERKIESDQYPNPDQPRKNWLKLLSTRG